MKRLELADDAARRTAKVTADENVVVVAGAGTGKTTLLVDRLLFLLLGQDVRAEGVVAVTFTEKAANEMRIRLERELAGGLDACRDERDAPGDWGERLELLRTLFHVSNEQVLERIRRSLDELPRATIGTIHSLAAQLLRLYPMEAGVAPGFEVDAGRPGDELERILDDEWRRWLDEELGDAPKRRRLWEEALDTFDLSTLRGLAEVLCRPHVATMHAAGRLLDARLPAPVLDRLRVLSGAAAGQQGGRGNLPALRAASLKLFDALLAGRAPEPDPDLALACKAKMSEDTRTALDLANAFADVDDHAIHLAAEVVAPLAERLGRRHLREGFVTFDGLIVFARDLLAKDRRARTEAKEGIQALLVDEFQDTDPVQQQLLLFLAEREADSSLTAEAVRLEPGKLFVVGDPKQSIYRFRGADVEVFSNVHRQVVEQGGVEVHLTTNFRSHAGLLDVVNEGFDRLLTGRKYQAPFVAIEPKPGRPRGPAVELWRVPTKIGEERVTAERAREIEGREVARFLAEGRHDTELRKVAILMRSMTSVHAYLDALRDREVPYVVEGEKHFYKAQEVLDLVNLLAAIADPNDRIALLGALRNPLFGLPDAEVCEVALAERLDWREDGPTEAAEAAFLVLRGLARGARTLPPPAFVDAILEETSLLDLLAQGEHGEQRTANVWKVRQLVEEASRRLGGDLVEVVRALRTSAEEEREEGESPLADETWNAVRVMSIHKAKGLEFDCVFVVNLASEGQSTTPEARAWIDERAGLAGLEVPPAISTAGAWLKLEERVREEEEQRRVLYVAMTRARERLILTGQAKEGAGMGLLVEAFGPEILDRDGEVALGKARISCLTLRVEEEAPARRERPEPGARAGDWRAFAERWRAREAEARSCGEGRSHVTPTALDEAEGARARDPRAARTGPADASRRTATADGLGPFVGQVCHAVLAEWDFAAGASALPEAVSRATGAIDGGEADRRKVEKEALDVLRAFLSGPYARRLAKAEFLGREVPFVLREEGGRLVSGQIDAVFRLDGDLVVADWKTDDVAEKEVLVAAGRHASQARCYRLAIERAGWGRPSRFELVYLRLGRAVPLA